MATGQLLQFLNENKAVFVFFSSLENMIRMKKAAGRSKDRDDLKFLRKLLKAKS